jgi:hypothetical protein
MYLFEGGNAQSCRVLNPVTPFASITTGGSWRGTSDGESFSIHAISRMPFDEYPFMNFQSGRFHCQLIPAPRLKNIRLLWPQFHG